MTLSPPPVSAVFRNTLTVSSEKLLRCWNSGLMRPHSGEIFKHARKVGSRRDVDDRKVCQGCGNVNSKDRTIPKLFDIICRFSVCSSTLPYVVRRCMSSAGQLPVSWPCFQQLPAKSSCTPSSRLQRPSIHSASIPSLLPSRAQRSRHLLMVHLS